MIPKKMNARKCSDHRTIRLMSHVLKLFLRILHSKVYNKIEEQLSETQFGFRNNLGTREALFSLQVLVQKCRDIQQPVFMCFITLRRPLIWSSMIRILQQVGIDDRDLRIVANLYWHQRANIRLCRTSEEVEIRRGVRQGCILSSLIFNIYSIYI